MSSKYLLIIHAYSTVRTLKRLLHSGFLEYDDHGFLSKGTISLKIDGHEFEYTRNLEHDTFEHRIAYVSTNFLSEVTNVVCLKSVFGDDVKFTLYKDVTGTTNVMLR